MKSRRVWYWLLAGLVAALLLYASLRGVSWRAVWQLLARAAPMPLVGAFALASGSLLLRAIRWRLLLRRGAPVPLSTVFAATTTGYCGNLFLPARAGELIRTLMISRAAGISKAFVLTTAFGERLSDAIALVSISSLTLLAMPEKPGWLARAAVPFAALGLAGVMAIVVLPLCEPLLCRWLGKLPLPERVMTAVQSAAEHVASGMRAFHNAKLLAGFATLTATVWLMDAWTALLIMRALGLPGTLPLALLLLTALALGSALPSTPGYVGVYQFAAVSVLTPFGYSKTDAIGYILLLQALQYVSIPFWAAWSALFWRIRFAPAAAWNERSA